MGRPPSCGGCPLHSVNPSGGFSAPDGLFTKGVVMVGEALGEEEEAEGKAFVGKSGHFLFNQLKRVGIERDDFLITNTVWCRPPNNKLVGMGWEKGAVAHCSPNLDGVLEGALKRSRAAGFKRLVILVLGKTAFKRVMGFEDKRDAQILSKYHWAYPFWSERYQAEVIAAPHPAFLIRGNQHLVPVLQFCAQRAVEIATEGVSPVKGIFLEDPLPRQFSEWVDGYLRELETNPATTYLSYDIETPYKGDKDEDEVGKEDAEGDPTFTILRCGFAYRPWEGVSIRWGAEYMKDLMRLFGSKGPKVGWNSSLFDSHRVRKQVGFEGGDIDGMRAWHTLNSALPKALGFVTPFYVHNARMWKHLNHARPAYYNILDAVYALQNWLGIQEDLKEGGQWEIFDSHVTKVREIFDYMGKMGVERDSELRDRLERELKVLVRDSWEVIEGAIPQEILKIKAFERAPSDTTGLIQIEGRRKTFKCSLCGALDVKADHFKSVGVKKLKGGAPENPCLGGVKEPTEVPATQWARREPFKLSNSSLQRYQRHMDHRSIIDSKKAKETEGSGITFDEKALMRLEKLYPKDPLYPKIVTFRRWGKLISTYVGETQADGTIRGGLPVGEDGRIHAIISDDPTTLRSNCKSPNLQNLPRGGDHISSQIRDMIKAQEGSVLIANDFSGIEALLVGYEARYPAYMRLAKRDVHSYYTAYALYELEKGKRISANDLPQLDWDDDRLFGRLAEIKREFKEDRNNLYKHLVHAANFAQTPHGAAEKILLETGIEYPVALVKRVMGVYFELFPKIRDWQKEVLAQADKDGYLQNAFGYIHRFNRAYDWEKIGDQWQARPGRDSNRIIAFKPQSSAAGIIKESLLRMFFGRFEEIGAYLRLLIHDENLLEVPLGKERGVFEILREEMERPVQAMPLPAEWGMGDYLTVATEGKIGFRWGSMKEWDGVKEWR